MIDQTSQRNAGPRSSVVCTWSLRLTGAALSLHRALAWAQASPVKVPKAEQLLNTLTGATAKSLGLTGTQKVWFGLAVILSVVLGLYLWRRYKTRKPKPAAAVSVAAPAPIERTRLSAVWRRFLWRLPGLFRRSIHNFPSFIVLGPAASGKTTVVTTYTDWQRQARQALESETNNPNLQVYLSSRAVAVEVPASLLQNTSAAARRAFARLFSRVARHRTPIAVVVIDLPDLEKKAPDVVRTLADSLRAKINILAAARAQSAGRKPVEVRVVLTHLDKISGFSAFAEFAQQHDIPLRFGLELRADAPPMAAQIRAGALGFGRYLRLALTKLPSNRFQEVLVFLKESPKYFELLEPLLATLCASDPLNQQPVLGPVYLACDRSIAAASNPFHLSQDRAGDGGVTMLGPHAIGALSVGALAAAWLLFGFVSERDQWRSAIDGIRTTTSSLFSEDARQRIRDFLSREQSYLPSFYGVGDDHIRAQLSENIRKNAILPGLDAAMQDEAWPHRKALYYLAILHASRDTKLGDHARDLAGKAIGRELGRDVVTDYVGATLTRYPRKIPLDRLPQRDVRYGFDAVPWLRFLEQVRSLIDRGHISETDLAELRDKAKQYRDGIRAIQEYDLTYDILKELPEYASDFDKYKADLDAAEKKSKVGLIEPMSSLLELILGTTHVEETASVYLPDFAGQLHAIASYTTTPQLFEVKVPVRSDRKGEDASGEAAHQIFKIDRSEWSSLIRRSRVRSLVNSFAAAAQTTHANQMFFRKEDPVRSFSLDTESNDALACAARGPRHVVLDGHYTKLAYDIQVLPRLKDFQRESLSLDKLEILPKPELQGLRAEVQHKVAQYASDYQREMDDFYSRAFSICADSSDALVVVFGQLAQSTSSLTAFLDIVYTNTDLNTTEDAGLAELLTPLAKVAATYEPIRKVVRSANGAPRELDTYLLIMEQIHRRLAAGTARPAPVSADAGLAGTLHDQLPPSGQMALERLTDPEKSVTQLVDSWLIKMGLRGSLALPFQQAPKLLIADGRRHLEIVIAQVWHYEVLDHLAPLMRKFPFDSSKEVEATALELEQAFHPKEGLVFDRYHRFFEPVVREAHGIYTPAPDGPKLPENLLPLLNHIAALTNTLWDSKGAPKPVEIRVRSIPFEPTRDMRSALTLAYVRFGDASVFNFNQQPATKRLELPWASPQISQVGVQLTNARNGEQRYPRSRVTVASRFSALRLLNLAETPPMGLTHRDPDGHVLTERRWRIPYETSDERAAGSGDTTARSSSAAPESYVSVRFVVEDDLLKVFDFSELTRKDEKRFAARKPEAR